MEQYQEFSNIKTIIKRRKWWFLFPFFCITAISIIIALILPDIFLSSATILIENQSIPQNYVSSPVTSYADQRIQTITQEIKARSRIFDIIKKYDLLSNRREKLTRDDLVEKVRERIHIEPINAEIYNQKQNQPILLTIAFNLSFEDENPRKAQAVVNEISTYYLEKNLASREKYVQNTTKFLNGQLNEIKVNMEYMQTKIADFRKNHLEEMPEFMSYNIQKLDKFNNELENINIKINTSEKKREILKNKLSQYNNGKISNSINSPNIIEQLELEQAKLLSKYSENHPLVHEKNREIALIREKIEPDTQIIPSYISLTTDLEELELSLIALKEDKTRLENEIKEMNGKLDIMPTVAQEFNQLDMDYTSAKNHYFEIKEKLLAAELSEGMEKGQLGEKFTIIEPAFLPDKPYKPNRVLIIALGFLIASGIATAAVSLKEYSDNTIRDKESLEHIAALPVLVSIPYLDAPFNILKSNIKKAVGIISLIIILFLLMYIFEIDSYLFYLKVIRFLKSQFII